MLYQLVAYSQGVGLRGYAHWDVPCRIRPLARQRLEMKWLLGTRSFRLTIHVANQHGCLAAVAIARNAQKWSVLRGFRKQGLNRFHAFLRFLC